MNDYLKQKLPVSPTSKGEDFISKDREYNQQLKELIASKPEMVEDFQKPMVKDLQTERINKVGDIQPIKSGADFKADQIIRDAVRQDAIKAAASNTLDYGQLRKEFADKAKLAARTGGRKLLGAIPLLGAGYAALSGEPAMAAEELAGDVPVLGQVYEAIKPTPTGPAEGSLDARIENGTLTDEDKIALQQQARIKALQNIGRNNE